MISDMAGVGGFVIGLADEIKVIDSPILEEYINKFVKDNIIKLVE